MPIKDLLVNTLPQYCETLASGKQMCFRPILVSEEKALLLAKHSNNKQSILKTLVSIINTCFNTQKDVSIYDFENMFLLLRAKSLGEIENFKIKCPETGETVDIKINLLTDIKLSKEKTSNKIKLNENLLVIFKEPTVKTLINYPEYTNSTEEMYNFIGSCMKEIQTSKESIDCSELSEKEVKDFIKNLTSSQYKSVISYFDNLPQLEVVADYKTSDGVVRQAKIKGLFNHISFFLTI